MQMEQEGLELDVEDTGEKANGGQRVSIVSYASDSAAASAYKFQHRR